MKFIYNIKLSIIQCISLQKSINYTVTSIINTIESLMLEFVAINASSIISLSHKLITKFFLKPFNYFIIIVINQIYIFLLVRSIRNKNNTQQFNNNGKSREPFKSSSNINPQIKYPIPSIYF